MSFIDTAMVEEGKPIYPRPVALALPRTRGATVTNDDTEETVRLNRSAYATLLRQADLPQDTKIPGWGNRTRRDEITGPLAPNQLRGNPRQEVAR